MIQLRIKCIPKDFQILRTYASSTLVIIIIQICIENNLTKKKKRKQLAHKSM